MGNINWNPQKFSYSSDHWLATQNPGILKSRQNNIQAHFQSFSELSHHDIKCFTSRSVNSACLVNVLAILDDSNSQHGFRCQNKQGYRVLIEKIPYRLPDLGAITIQDGLYILRQGVRAVGALSQLFDDYIIEQQAIGINAKGQCKYWINTNYFKNSVESTCQSRQQVGYQQIQESKRIANNPQQQQKNESNLNTKQKQSCIPDSKIKCIPECDRSGAQNKIKAKQGQHLNIHKILESLLGTIQNKMLASITQSQLQKYNRMKQYFFQPKAQGIAQRSQLSSSKENGFNEKTQSYVYKIDFKQYSPYGQILNKGKLQYSLGSMQKFVDNLCAIFNIGEQYFIELPQQEDSAGFGEKLDYVNSNIIRNINSNIGIINKKSKVNLCKAKMASHGHSKSYLKLENLVSTNANSDCISQQQYTRRLSMINIKNNRDHNLAEAQTGKYAQFSYKGQKERDPANSHINGYSQAFNRNILKKQKYSALASCSVPKIKSYQMNMGRNYQQKLCIINESKKVGQTGNRQENYVSLNQPRYVSQNGIGDVVGTQGFITYVQSSSDLNNEYYDDNLHPNKSSHVNIKSHTTSGSTNSTITNRNTANIQANDKTRHNSYNGNKKQQHSKHPNASFNSFNGCNEVKLSRCKLIQKNISWNNRLTQDNKTNQNSNTEVNVGSTSQTNCDANQHATDDNRRGGVSEKAISHSNEGSLYYNKSNVRVSKPTSSNVYINRTALTNSQPENIISSTNIWTGNSVRNYPSLNSHSMSMASLEVWRKMGNSWAINHNYCDGYSNMLVIQKTGGIVNKCYI